MRFQSAFLLAVMTTAAYAQAPDAGDRKTIEACLEAKPGEGATCIGKVSQPCLDSGADPSTAGMVGCHERELLVWDALLNEEFRSIQEGLDAKQVRAMRDVQRAWIAFRDKRCGFYWIYYGGTIAHPMAASCMADETARRAIELKDLQSQ